MQYRPRWIPAKRFRRSRCLTGAARMRTQTRTGFAWRLFLRQSDDLGEVSHGIGDRSRNDKIRGDYLVFWIEMSCSGTSWFMLPER
jgi:hypothetical protein